MRGVKSLSKNSYKQIIQITQINWAQEISYPKHSNNNGEKEISFVFLKAFESGLYKIRI